MLLAPVCLGWLIYFIHHISNAISVNHIVDRIARETELVIDALMPEPRRPFLELPLSGVVPDALELVIASRIQNQDPTALPPRCRPQGGLPQRERPISSSRWGINFFGPASAGPFSSDTVGMDGPA